tara:strand:- start:5034 stop:5513 length:480 start_codon:yes stop_codon:yes gene_type:complete
MEQQHVSVEYQTQLAGRGARLVASLIDSLILAIFILPLMYFTGGFSGLMQSPPVEPSLGYLLVIGFVNFVLFGAINRTLLRDKGQTIGKKVMKIRIQGLDGKTPRLTELLFKRYAYYFLIGYVPVVGGFISILGVLFIFGKSRRCVHDFIASTQVVRAT